MSFHESGSRAFVMMSKDPGWTRQDNAGPRERADIEFVVDLQHVMVSGCSGHGPVLLRHLIGYPIVALSTRTSSGQRNLSGSVPSTSSFAFALTRCLIDGTSRGRRTIRSIRSTGVRL